MKKEYQMKSLRKDGTVTYRQNMTHDEVVDLLEDWAIHDEELHAKMHHLVKYGSIVIDGDKTNLKVKKIG